MLCRSNKKLGANVRLGHIGGLVRCPVAYPDTLRKVMIEKRKMSRYQNGYAFGRKVMNFRRFSCPGNAFATRKWCLQGLVFYSLSACGGNCCSDPHHRRAD